ncbi:MAG TPA: MBL fold metallo-hydrolase [Solimonas sp.]|nr:MBL fold metallo-hydrolase [Solimonas sp.]
MRRLKRFLLVLLAVSVLLGVIALAVFRLPVFGGDFDGERLQRMQASPQYRDGRFDNTPVSPGGLNLVETTRHYLGGQQREPGFGIPVIPLPPESLKARPAPGLRAWWFGHATAMVEIDGMRVLTDPVLSMRASPFQFAGPQRFHPPPIPLELLTGIDAVVISHDHFDHLDMATVRQLAGGGTHFYVGLGIGAHLQRWNVPPAQIHEMDWWQSVELGGVRIHCTPARHYSGRKRMDNSTLWASWMLQGPQHSVYYSGDTGYAPHFAEIRRRLGTPQLALMKVGAYGDPWLDIHMDPESAVRAHQDLGAATLLPLHWATFNLAYHAWDEPILRTLAAAQASGVRVVTPRIGERYDAGQPFDSTAWYRRP